MSFLKLFFSGILLSFTVTSCNTLGCMDETAENYKANATEDNGECVYINGCTDENGLYYNEDATKDDGTCQLDTTGSVIFWTDGPFMGGTSSIKVDITKEVVSSALGGAAEFKESLEIREYHGESPGCSGFKQIFKAAPGTYKYTASSSTYFDEGWEGEFTVALGQCKNKLLKHVPKIKYTGTYDSYKGGSDNNEIYIVNKYSYEYRVYAFTIAGYDVSVKGNSTARIRNLSDNGDWKIRISKNSKERGTGNCEGFSADLITGVNFQSGLVYKIVIGE